MRALKLHTQWACTTGLLPGAWRNAFVMLQSRVASWVSGCCYRIVVQLKWHSINFIDSMEIFIRFNHVSSCSSIVEAWELKSPEPSPYSRFFSSGTSFVVRCWLFSIICWFLLSVGAQTTLRISLVSSLYIRERTCYTWYDSFNVAATAVRTINGAACVIYCNVKSSCLGARECLFSLPKFARWRQRSMGSYYSYSCERVLPNDTHFSRFHLLDLPNSNCIKPAKLERLKCVTFVSEMLRYDADSKTRRYLGTFADTSRRINIFCKKTAMFEGI